MFELYQDNSQKDKWTNEFRNRIQDFEKSKLIEANSLFDENKLNTDFNDLKYFYFEKLKDKTNDIINNSKSKKSSIVSKGKNLMRSIGLLATEDRKTLEELVIDLNNWCAVKLVLVWLLLMLKILKLIKSIFNQIN